MSLVQQIRKQPQKKQDIIVATIAGFLLVIIILIGIFFYNPPYKKTRQNSGAIFEGVSVRGMISDAQEDADAFVDPIDQLFIQ